MWRALGQRVICELLGTKEKRRVVEGTEKKEI